VFGDPILASMWQERPAGFLESRVLSGPGVNFVELAGETYVFLHRELSGYSDRPLIIGTYLPSVDLLSEVFRLKWAIVLCLLISVLSSLTAAYIGRQISRPVRRLSEGAMKVHDLDLASVDRIPGSFFSELNDAARSFNTMLDGLRWFERYVPKSLVTRLIRLHQRQGITSQFREVAIMFTDIVGFTAMSESMTATEAAEILNKHFTMVAGIVEAEGGIIDKYIGDAVMAVYGTPETYPDPADRACRAALAIERGVHAFNAERAADGLPTIRLRISIHLGRVVVGNIGSPGRINYTVVGDAVNVARRMEENCTHLGRKDENVNILLSGRLRDDLKQPFNTPALGRHKLRGRQGEVEIYALLEDDATLADAEDAPISARN